MLTQFRLSPLIAATALLASSCTQLAFSAAPELMAFLSMLLIGLGGEERNEMGL